MFEFEFVPRRENPFETIGYDYVKFYKIPIWFKITKLVMKPWFTTVTILPDTLLYFKMGSGFNKPIDLPDSLIYFEMGFSFQQLITLPDTLQCLIMGYDFNQFILLPNTLLYLTIGRHYNCSITLPKTLRYLEIHSEGKHLYGMILPESLKTIIYYGNRNFFSNNCVAGARWFDSIPNSVKTIGFKCDYVPIAKPLPNLPNSVKYVINSNIVYKYNDLLKNYVCVDTNSTVRNILTNGIQICTLSNGEVIYDYMCMEIDGVAC